MRGAALRALGRLGEWPEEASRALTDPDPAIRVAALDALEAVLRQHPKETPIAPRRVDPVLELLFDADETVVARAVAVLGAAQELRDRQEAGGVLPVDAQGKRLAARLKELYRRPGISQDAVLELLLPGRWRECFQIADENLGAKDERTVGRALYVASRMDPDPRFSSSPRDVELEQARGILNLRGKVSFTKRYVLTAPLIALLGDPRQLPSDLPRISVQGASTTASGGQSVDSVAWSILSSQIRTSSVLEALVTELPRVDASSIGAESRQQGRRPRARSNRRRSTRNSSDSRVATVLEEIVQRQRRDIFVQALGHYEALSLAGRVVLLQHLRAGDHLPNEAITMVASGLRDPALAVRKAAFRAALRSPDRPEAFFSAAREAFRDRDEEIRYHATRLIADATGDDAMALLFQALEDETEGVVQSAVKALGGRRDRQAIPHVLRLLQRADLPNAYGVFSLLRKLA